MLSSANESIGTGSADTPDFCDNDPPFHIRENNDAATSSKTINFPSLHRIYISVKS
jgi:hypothetical protein